MSDTPFATGRCLCGKVSYNITSERKPDWGFMDESLPKFKAMPPVLK